MNFPERIWDGTHTSRPELTTDKGVDTADYAALVTEIKTTQESLKEVLDSIDLLPTFELRVKSFTAKIQNIEKEIDSKEIPEDLALEVAEIRKTLQSFINSTKLETIRETLAGVVLRLGVVETTVQEFDERWDTDVRAFQRDTWKYIKAVEQTVDDKITAFNTQLAALANLLKG